MKGFEFNALARPVTLAAVGCTADQMSKAWVLHVLEQGVPIAVAPFLNLRLGFNTGISFGLFGNSGPAVQILVLTATSSIVVWLAGLLVRGAQREALGLSLIIGGAGGNLTDRFVRGRVTDFIDVYADGWHWPAFNMADVLITLGTAWVFLVNLVPALRRRA